MIVFWVCVVQLLKSWEYKNSSHDDHTEIRLYSYLNLESTKTPFPASLNSNQLYSYLNLESTKTFDVTKLFDTALYSYLNLESTKTECERTT